MQEKEIDKIEVYETIIYNLTRKIIDINLEIRVLTRMQIGANDETLLGTERQITGNKDLIKYYETKIDIAKEEINAELKRRDAASGSGKKSAPR